MKERYSIKRPRPDQTPCSQKTLSEVFWSQHQNLICGKGHVPMAKFKVIFGEVSPIENVTTNEIVQWSLDQISPMANS